MELETRSVIDEDWFITLTKRKQQLIRLNRESDSLKIISVFGGSAALRGSTAWNDAYQIGRLLAEQDCAVMNGGYNGIMEATAEGARSVDGLTIGITCDNIKGRSTNKHIIHDWHVQRWDQRLLALVWLADGYIILPGSSGTLVELSMVMETQSKHFLPPHPAVCLGDFWKPVVGKIDKSGEHIGFADSVAECVVRFKA